MHFGFPNVTGDKIAGAYQADAVALAVSAAGAFWVTQCDRRQDRRRYQADAVAPAVFAAGAFWVTQCYRRQIADYQADAVAPAVSAAGAFRVTQCDRRQDPCARRPAPPVHLWPIPAYQARSAALPGTAVGANQAAVALSLNFRTPQSPMIEEFRRLFGSAEGIEVYRAPGRVNLIGEHTDYNLGFVCPVALQLATFIAAAPSADGRLRIYSEDRGEMREWEAASLGRLERAGHWSDYPIGVARELAAAGFAVGPANLLIRSSVPEGSGLSSSAALEVSSALAFLAGRSLPPLDLALLCQRAEVRFVGMPCGVMDQYISVFGRRGMAVEIDCRSLEHRDVELPAGAAFVAVNSMVKHELAGSAYRRRVEECAAAVAGIRAQFPAVESLRDVSTEQLAAVAPALPETVARRARHVVTENARVERFREAGAAGDLEAMGRLMVESHGSLRDDYEVSSPELDFLVEGALAVPGVFGSRMTGGGFGGCTVTMLRPDAVGRFRAEIAGAYAARFQVDPQIYECQPSEGAGVCTELEKLPVAPGVIA